MNNEDICYDYDTKESSMVKLPYQSSTATTSIAYNSMFNLVEDASVQKDNHQYANETPQFNIQIKSSTSPFGSRLDSRLSAKSGPTSQLYSGIKPRQDSILSFAPVPMASRLESKDEND